MTERVVVVGATGGTGRAVVEAARAAGRPVLALSRRGERTSPDVDVARLDLAAGVHEGLALRPSDAVIVVVGPVAGAPPDLCARGTRIVVEAMRAAGCRRLVVQTGAMAGHGNLRGVYRLPRLLGADFTDRVEQERVTRESDLDWTIVRPPRLTDEPVGPVRVGEDLRIGSLARVPRASVARWIVDALDDPAWYRRAVAVVAA